jgi:hypothetical protein
VPVGGPLLPEGQILSRRIDVLFPGWARLSFFLVAFSFGSSTVSRFLGLLHWKRHHPWSPVSSWVILLRAFGFFHFLRRRLLCRVDAGSKPLLRFSAEIRFSSPDYLAFFRNLAIVGHGWFLGELPFSVFVISFSFFSFGASDCWVVDIDSVASLRC